MIQFLSANQVAIIPKASSRIIIRLFMNPPQSIYQCTAQQHTSSIGQATEQTLLGSPRVHVFVDSLLLFHPELVRPPHEPGNIGHPGYKYGKWFSQKQSFVYGNSNRSPGLWGNLSKRRQFSQQAKITGKRTLLVNPTLSNYKLMFASYNKRLMESAAALRVYFAISKVLHRVEI